MKRSLLLPTIVFLMTQCLQADSPLPEIVVLANFAEKPLEFLYGSWSERMDRNLTGIQIAKGATAKGGGGASMACDLSLLHGLSITLKVLPENMAAGVNIILHSPDKRASGYSFSLEEAPVNSTTMIVDLSKPFFQPNDATNGHADLSNITRFQIQGNFKDDAPLAIEFEVLEAVAPKS